MRAIAHKELSDKLKSKWVIVIGSGFALFTLVISYFGGATAGVTGFMSLEATIASLTSLVTYFIPILALTLGGGIIADEQEKERELQKNKNKVLKKKRSSKKKSGGGGSSGGGSARDNVSPIVYEDPVEENETVKTNIISEENLNITTQFNETEILIQELNSTPGICFIDDCNLTESNITIITQPSTELNYDGVDKEDQEMGLFMKAGLGVLAVLTILMMVAMYKTFIWDKKED